MNTIADNDDYCLMMMNTQQQSSRLMNNTIADNDNYCLMNEYLYRKLT